MFVKFKQYYYPTYPTPRFNVRPNLNFGRTPRTSFSRLTLNSSIEGSSLTRTVLVVYLPVFSLGSTVTYLLARVLAIPCSEL